jgi:His-Xaa-Ser system protein HxsD
MWLGIVLEIQDSQMKDVTRKTKTLVVTLDSKVFSLIAVKKAAYKFLRNFSVDISLQSDLIHCELSLSSCISDEERDLLVEDFRKEILDQDLRERLKSETEAVRNVILAYAFSKTGLISDESLSRD